MNRDRVLQSIVLTLVTVVLTAAVMPQRSYMTPNRFELNFQTYLDGYDVYAEVVSGSGQVRRLGEGDTRSAFFSRSTEELRIILEKHPAISGEQLLRTGSSDWHWRGRVPAPKQLAGVMLQIRDGISADQLTVRVNGQSASYVHQDGAFSVFEIVGDQQEFQLYDLEISSTETEISPIQNIYVMEQKSQAINVKELVLFRDIREFNFLYYMHKWDAELFLQDFTVISGAEVHGLHSDFPFAKLYPYNPVVILEYSNDLQKFHAATGRHGRPVRILVYLISLFLPLMVFYLSWQYQPLDFARKQLTGYRKTAEEQAGIPWMERTVWHVKGAELLFLLLVFASAALTQFRPGGLLYSAAAVTSALAAWGLFFRTPEASALLAPRLPHQHVMAHLQRHAALYGWLGFALVALFMGASHLYRLGDGYMWLDEAYSFFPAKYILETGEPIYPQTGYPYYRAYTYHRIVAQSMSLLGVNAWAARLPNVLFNTGTLLVLFLLGKQHKPVSGVLSAVIWASLNYVLSYTRWVRMYPMQWFLFALAAYLLYLAISSRPRPRIELRFRKLDLAFSPIPLVLFLPVYLLALETHPVSIILVFGLLVFFLAEMLNQNTRYRGVVGAGVILLILVLGAYLTQGTINVFQAFFGHGPTHTLGSPPKLSHVTRVIREIHLLWFLFPAAAVLSLKTEKSILRYVVALSAGGIWFIGNQYAQNPRYWSALLPFITLSLVIVLIELLACPRVSRVLKTLSVSVLLAIPIYGHVQRFSLELGQLTHLFDESGILAHTKLDYGFFTDYIDLYVPPGKIAADLHASYSIAAHGYPVARAFRQSADYLDTEGEPSHRLGIPYFWYTDVAAELDASSFLFSRRFEPSLVTPVQNDFWLHPGTPGSITIMVPQIKPLNSGTGD